MTQQSEHRVRTFNKVRVIRSFSRQTRTPSLPNYPIYTEYAKPMIWTETQDGYTNPTWKSQVANGENAATPYTRNYVRIRDFETSGFTQEVGSIYKFSPADTAYVFSSGDFPADIGSLFASGLAVPYTSPFGSDAGTIAANRFRASMVDAMRPFMAPVFLKDFHATLKLIAHPFQALVRGLNAFFVKATKLRQRHVLHHTVSARKLIRETSKLWLEYVFGWRPLLKDIEGAVAVYSGLRDRLSQEIDISGKARVEVNDFNDQYSQASFPGFVVQQVSRGVHYDSVKIVGAVSVDFRPAVDPYSIITHEQLRSFGMSLQDIAGTIWEMVPFSFVVDYFVNIGQLLDQCAYQSVQPSWASTATRTGRKRTFVFVGGPYDYSSSTYYVDSYRRTRGNGTITFDYGSFTRTPGSSVYTPGLVLRLPSLYQFGNLLALIGSFLGVKS